jgi:hypothetical protein
MIASYRLTMSKALRLVPVLLVALFLSGCFHWAAIDSLDEIARESRVRVEASDQAPMVLDHPSVEQVRAFVTTHDRPRVEVKRLRVWATVLIVTAASLATLFTGFVIFGIAVSGAAGG